MISAVVINWNGRHYLQGCLDALLAQAPAPAEVILLDNHSDDGSREFVAERYPGIRIIDTGYNAGPAYARNMGVEAATAERVLLIDNDVTMTEGALASMVATMDAHPQAALVQARSVCADAPDLVHYDASDLHYLGLLVLHNWFVPRARAVRPARAIGGLIALCFLADRRRFLDVGGFNPDLFILFEDTDLAWRLRMRGGEIRLAPAAIVRHGGGTAGLSLRATAATTAYPAQRVYLHSRNRWLVLATCLHWRSLVVLAPAQLTYGAIQMVFACLRGHPLAWLRGKIDQVRLLSRVRAWRRAAQVGRTVADRHLLIAAPLTLNPGLAERGPARWIRSAMDRGFALYWKAFGRLCG